MLRLTSVFGLFAMIAIAWLFSTNRRVIPWRIIAGGLILQISFALVVLETEVGHDAFEALGIGYQAVAGCADAGSQFVFGEGFGAKPSDPTFAFRVLPVIIFFSALMSVLFHFGVIQFIVRCLGWLMQRTLRTSGAESLAAAANIFFGQTEAPFLVKPYLEHMTDSELHSLMVGGFATIAGSVMAVYVTTFEVDAGHLLTASVISAPAALLVAKVMHPETGTPETAGFSSVRIPRTSANVFDAITQGTTDGLKLALNVAAMLIAFLALIALVNLGLQQVNADWSLAAGLGKLFGPFAWLLGVESGDTQRVGELIGTKIVATELIAYADMKTMVDAGQISERSRTIATYALCGFANFGSVGIQIGGLAALAPSRTKDFARLGFRAMIGGTLAAFMTACIAGALIPA